MSKLERARGAVPQDTARSARLSTPHKPDTGMDLLGKYQAAEAAMASNEFRQASALFAEVYVAANAAVAALPPGHATHAKLQDTQVRLRLRRCDCGVRAAAWCDAAIGYRDGLRRAHGRWVSYDRR